MLEYWEQFQHVPLCSGGIDEHTQKSLLHCLAMEPRGAGPTQYLLQVGLSSHQHARLMCR
jgi:hypothetical protein